MMTMTTTTAIKMTTIKICHLSSSRRITAQRMLPPTSMTALTIFLLSFSLGFFSGCHLNCCSVPLTLFLFPIRVWPMWNTYILPKSYSKSLPHGVPCGKRRKEDREIEGLMIWRQKRCLVIVAAAPSAVISVKPLNML